MNSTSQNQSVAALAIALFCITNHAFAAGATHSKKKHHIHTTHTKMAKTKRMHEARYKTSVKFDLPDPSAMIRQMNEALRRKDIFEAIAFDDAKSVTKFLDSGVKINDGDSDGIPPLWHAEMNNNVPMLKLLISRGANVNITCSGSGDVTALKEAELLNYDSVTSYLKSVGAVEQGIVSAPRNFGILRVTEETMRYASDSSLARMEGRVTNTSKYTLKYVEVSVVFMGGSEQVDNGLTNTNYLGPGETWKFQISSTKPEATSYKITSVTGHQ